MTATLAKLWNDNEHPYQCKYQDQEIKIPAKGFIEGDLYFLNDVKCQYHQATWLDDTAKIQDPKSFKKLRLEIAQKPEVGHVCMKCKINLPSEKTLALHLDEAHSNAPRVADPNEAPMAPFREPLTADTPATGKSKARGT